MSPNRSLKPLAFIRKAPLNDNTRLRIDATVDQLIRVAPRAGFSIHDLNKLLDSGLELDELLIAQLPQRSNARPEGECQLATDPVCTMEVDEETTEFTSEYDGETYYFCSNACKEEFESGPEEYIAAA
jgi:YHS domain-containing protein